MTTFNLTKPCTVGLADAGLLLAAVAWGSSFPVMKLALGFSPVMVFLFIRFAVTGLLMLPFFFAKSKGAVWQTLGVGSALGLVLFLVFFCETEGAYRTSAANAAFLISLCVLFTPLLESGFAKKVPSAKLIGACLLYCVGAGLIGFDDSFKFEFNAGDLIILLAAVLRSIGVIVAKRLMRNVALDSAAVTSVQMSMVAVIAGLCLLSSGVNIRIPDTPIFWESTIYLALFCTMLAFYLQNHIVRKTSPTRVILIMGTEPLFGAFFAVVLLGDSLSEYQMLGGLLIVASTYLGMLVHHKESQRSAVEALPSTAQ